MPHPSSYHTNAHTNRIYAKFRPNPPHHDAATSCLPDDLCAPHHDAATILPARRPVWLAAGMLLHTLRMPAARVGGLAWDARGERLALATGLSNPGPGHPAPAPAGQLLLATVRCAHAWAYLGISACSGAGTAARCRIAGAGGTLVYAYRSAAGAGTCVAFWDTRSGERRMKTVRRLLAIAVSNPTRAPRGLQSLCVVKFSLARP